MQRIYLATLVGALLALSCGTTEAAVPVTIVKTDLRPLIRAAANSRVQFAVHVPHSASPDADGIWSSNAGSSTWRYAVRVPTAVSLSFHATPAHLPDGALLTVRSAATTVTYNPTSFKRDHLWSRIQPGDTLELILTVPSASRSKVALRIISLQAGYRGLDSSVPDHPYYRRLRQIQSSSTNGSCVQNYACNISSANTPAGQATVALVIANTFTCTGALINDVPNDNAPYVLTARHCEGAPGGGSPGQAASVSVYWNAQTPCGQSLGSVYDPSIPTQTGASTIVEQQDMWLIELNDNPVVTNAQFVGFDASGGTIVGGYSVHHAMGFDKQFTEWYGQALPVQQSGVLGVTYVSDFLEVVNQLGNVGHGASGGGLIDQNNHLVGSLTLGFGNDDSGYGSCPVSPPAAPDGINTVASFTSLAAVWNSTADATSSTGSATLRSVLDPANTGTLVVQSMPAAAITFTTSAASLDTGQTAQLTWSTPNALQCTASGGLPGDGWSGAVATNGSQSVSEGSGATVTYTLTCTLPSGRSISSSVAIFWYGSVPYVFIDVARQTVWTTRPAAISWNSNVSPCALSGGALSVTNQPSSGTITATQSTPGDVTYQVSCGSGPTATSASTTVTYATPSLVLLANANDRILGENLTLEWQTWADSCSAAGGETGDGWEGTTFGPFSDYYSPRPSTVGTYTYTLTCVSGPLSVTQSVMVTIENNAPYVTASLSPASTTYTASPADYITVDWTTNLSQCVVNQTPILGNQVGPPALPGLNPFLADGPAIIAPQQPGTYTLSVSCSDFNFPTVTSPPMIVTVGHPPPPTASISVSPTSIATGQQFTVTWSSTNASGCTATGDINPTGALWTGGGPGPASGSATLGVNHGQGQYTIGVSCQSIDNSQGAATAETSITITPPPTTTATLSVSTAGVTQEQSFTLTWSSTNANGCTASGGGADGGAASGSAWTGTLPPTGSMTQTATIVGTFTYTVTCGGTSGDVTSAATIVVSTAAPAPSPSGHGGGGGFGLLELCCGLGTLSARLRRRRGNPSKRVAGLAGPRHLEATSFARHAVGLFQCRCS